MTKHRHHEAEALGILLDANNRSEADDHVRAQAEMYATRLRRHDGRGHLAAIHFGYCQRCRIEIDEQGAVCPGCGAEPSHRGIR